MQFLELEGGYLGIALFILAITAFVTTRSFMSKQSFRYGMTIVGSILVLLIGMHYGVTLDRIEKVKTAFDAGEDVICENRGNRNAARTLIINKKRGWVLNEGIFTSKEFERGFHSARCVPHM